MAIKWTDKDDDALRRSEVIIFQQNLSESQLDDKGLPTDIHVVEYTQNGTAYSDVVRSMKMSNIFDVYFDKLKEEGGCITAIKNGFGTIKPNMYNPPEDKKKKG